MKFSICALSTDTNKDKSCLSEEHVQLLTRNALGNSLDELKKETGCLDERCVVEAAAISQEEKEKILLLSFKPEVPVISHQHWLNNTSIDSVMVQLQRLNPGFAHGYIHMIDLVAIEPKTKAPYPVPSVKDVEFAKEIKHALHLRGLLDEGVPNFVSKLATGGVPLCSYGLICNTDSSDGAGRHWFAIFICTDQKDPTRPSAPKICIELFNSAGGGVNDAEFNAFWETQALEISRETGLNCSYYPVSNIEHQSPKTGNCGAYSLFYIYSRLLGERREEFDNPKKTVSDNNMLKFREVCFTLPSSKTK